MYAVIEAVGTANPPLFVTQADAFKALCALFDLTDDEKSLYQKLCTDGRIRGRHLALDTVPHVADTDPDALIARYSKYARSCAGDAAKQAMARAGCAADQIDVIVVNTCTGYLCPGLTSYLIEDLGLRKSVRTLDIQGMGCGGAIPNLQSACGLLKLEGKGRALCVAVEMCSATLFMDPDPGIVVSNTIFGDGAAALVISTEASASSPRVVDMESVTRPEHREALRYRTEQHRLRNVLTREVPVLAAQASAQVIDTLITRNDLMRNDIAHWIVHPGGSEVLNRFEKRLNLTPDALRHAYAVFEAYGNMSSPSVWFVLDRLLTEKPPTAGEWGVLCAFGAGFSAYAALIRF